MAHLGIGSFVIELVIKYFLRKKLALHKLPTGMFVCLPNSEIKLFLNFLDASIFLF